MAVVVLGEVAVLSISLLQVRLEPTVLRQGLSWLSLLVVGVVMVAVLLLFPHQSRLLWVAPGGKGVMAQA